MGELYQTVSRFFEENNWPVAVLQPAVALQTQFNGDNGKWFCVTYVREEQQQVIFYSTLPVNAPEAQRQAVAEFITRANCGLFIGNFELDFNDGEIRYKTSIDVSNDRLSPALVEQIVSHNIVITDLYLPGLMSVIYGGKSSAEAIAEIES